MGDMVQILNLVTQGGAVVLLALLGLGLYRLARDIVPVVKDFFTQLVTALGALQAKVAVIESKVDAVGVASAAASAASNGAIGKVSDSVQAESFEVKEEIRRAERAITAVVRREQVSDPPPPPASRSFMATPSAGIPNVRRPVGA